MTNLRFLLAFALVAGGARAQDSNVRESTVGMPGRLEQYVIPGSELEPIPNEDRKSPLVVRILKAYPHGDAFRYDLEFYGLDPGEYDLLKFVRRKDGSPVGNVSIPVRITPMRPPGQVLPNALEEGRLPQIGGYRRWMTFAVIVWCVGFVAIVYFGFLRRTKKGSDAATEKVPTLAERLRPLVDGAIAGRLSKPELANLERSLIAFWRKRLKLEESDPADAIEQLRSDDQAGPLLDQLEKWLHHPGATGPVEPGTLLAPYREIRAEEWEATA